MPSDNNLEAVLQFLAGLRQNNQKSWFEAHRSDYASARRAFEALVDTLIAEFRQSDRLEGLAALDCIPRIYRDVRFSKDKSPYKTNFGALIGPGGWKSSHLGYYISLEPGGLSMAAGGLYNPEAQQLERFRRSVDRSAGALKRLTGAPEFVRQFGALSGERLKTAPKGYDRAHPEIDLLQLKQITAVRHFADAEVLAPDFAAQAASACRAMRPFLQYLDEILEG